MCVGSCFVVLCMDCIKDEAEKQQLISSIQLTKKQLISISFDQMNHFAGNMLELQNTTGESLVVMSKSAWESLNYEQRSILSAFSKPVYADISTIESNGGGSARCMIAEVHLPHIS